MLGIDLVYKCAYHSWVEFEWDADKARVNLRKHSLRWPPRGYPPGWRRGGIPFRDDRARCRRAPDRDSNHLRSGSNPQRAEAVRGV